MIKSMTGYGKATCHVMQKNLTIEIRSVNSKQFDLNLRLPFWLRPKEQEIRTAVAHIAERGKLDLCFNYETSSEKSKAAFNASLVKDYYKQLKALATELKAGESDLLRLSFTMPNVFDTKVEEASEADLKKIMKELQSALQDFNKHREHEGKSLEKDLLSHIKNITTLLKNAEEEDKMRLPIIKERIRKNLSEAVGKEKIDHNRFEQELIFFIERNDITEEKVRLKTHCDYFTQTIREPAAGRKLAFIAQEIGREINTIGSKANHAGIQKLVVQMKDELEKIKEQLNNIL